MSSPVAPKTDLCWKRRQHKLSALADSLRNSASKPDVSGIETAIAKRRSQKFSRSPIQPKEEPGWSRQTAHSVPQPTSVTARLYIRTAFSVVCPLEERHVHPPSGPLPQNSSCFSVLFRLFSGRLRAGPQPQTSFEIARPLREVLPASHFHKCTDRTLRAVAPATPAGGGQWEAKSASLADKRNLDKGGGQQNWQTLIRNIWEGIGLQPASSRLRAVKWTLLCFLPQ
jgi:hypothetical protein